MMHWHKYVAGHNPMELKVLVAMPKKEEFPGLCDGIKRLFELGMEVMDMCPELVLQRLNMLDPAKT